MMFANAYLVSSVALMAVFVAVTFAIDASFYAFAGMGILVLATYMAADELRSLADRAVFSPASRAGRASMRSASAYIGTERSLDVETISPRQAAEVVDHYSTIDRAGVATARLGGQVDPLLALFGREQFAAVREALGLPQAWRADDGCDVAVARSTAVARLTPRGRQALGLKYLGYSDKQMAQLMRVKANVPRSYLGAAKRKLDLSAGAPLMLFVYLSGLAESDALPLLAISAAGAASPQPAAQMPSDAPAEKRS